MGNSHFGGGGKYIPSSPMGQELSAQRSIDIEMCQLAFARVSAVVTAERVGNGTEGAYYRSICQVYYILKNICRDLGKTLKCASEKQRAMFIRFIGEEAAARIRERHTQHAVAVAMPLPKKPPGRA